MTGFWRSIYGLLGWSYWDEWSPRQRHLKFECCKQIEKSKLILRAPSLRSGGETPGLRTKKPSVDINPYKVVQDPVGNRKVRVSKKIDYIPPVPTNSPDRTEYAEHITELKTLFKQKRKNSWNNKKSWRRQNALQTKVFSTKQKIG